MIIAPILQGCYGDHMKWWSKALGMGQAHGQYSVHVPVISPLAPQAHGSFAHLGSARETVFPVCLHQGSCNLLHRPGETCSWKACVRPLKAALITTSSFTELIKSNTYTALKSLPFSTGFQPYWSQECSLSAHLRAFAHTVSSSWTLFPHPFSSY